MITKDLEDLQKWSKIKNLRIVSNYNDIKDANSKVKWKCLVCDYEFINSIINLKRKKYPCPNCPRFSYEDCIKVAENSDKNIEFAMTCEEFNDAMKNRGEINPINAHLKWRCKKERHEWWASSNNIKNLGSGCPYCAGIIPITYEDCIKAAENSDKNVEFVMTREEFNDVMKNRGEIYPSNVHLKWKCKNQGHKWEASYNSIKNKISGCPYCAGIIPITYEDCIKAAENSDKNIEFAMTREEFNDVMINKGETNPAKVNLRWRCVIKKHEWEANYDRIKNSGTGCPYCGYRKKVIGILIHPIFEFLSIKLLE